MYNNIREMPPLKLELDTTKALVIMFSVLVFFALPILGIAYYQNTSSSSEINNQVASKTSNVIDDSGRVAGVSTDEPTISILPKSISPEARKFVFIGAFFLITGISLTTYLLYDHIQYKRANSPSYFG